MVDELHTTLKTKFHLSFPSEEQQHGHMSDIGLSFTSACTGDFSLPTLSSAGGADGAAGAGEGADKDKTEASSLAPSQSK